MRIMILISLLLGATFGFTQEGHPSNVVITLERTACLGTCPVYKVTITGDGGVDYEGKEYVRVVGTRRAKINPAEVEHLVQAFQNIHYFDLKDAYRSITNPDGTETIVTDLPTTYTSLSLDGRHMKVEDYVGAPKDLEELEGKIDATANTKRWVAIDEATVHEDARHGWKVNGLDARRLFLDAVQRGDADVVQAFIDENIDVNAPIGSITPLQVAGTSAVVKALIAAGADVNVASKEYFGPPLVHAAELGDVESVRALLDAGAKVNGSNSDKETALMKAAYRGNVNTVKVLLSAGAQVNMRASSGETALDYARHWLDGQHEMEKHPDPFEELVPDFEQKFKEMQDLLMSAGAESKH